MSKKPRINTDEFSDMFPDKVCIYRHDYTHRWEVWRGNRELDNFYSFEHAIRFAIAEVTY